MMPVKSKYGPWPASGEIDIMESRGNQPGYVLGGVNTISSTLHWAPNSLLDSWSWWRTTGAWETQRGNYNEGFHIYGLEWNENYLYTYLDNRLTRPMNLEFNEAFWQLGNFPPADSNNTVLVDPWSQTGLDSTPFDQDFYLILSLAVGSTNNWFPDGYNGKPWVDLSPTAAQEFYSAKNKWLPTWGNANQSSMVIKSVKMYQQGACPAN